MHTRSAIASVLIQAVLFLLTLAPMPLLAEHQAKTLASVDVAKESPAYATAVSMRPLPGTVKVIFLSENELAVSSIDGIDSPVSGASQNRLVAEMHLTLDFFQLDSTGLHHSGQLQFATDTSHSSVAALPDGRFLVSAGRRILLYGKNHEVVVESTMERVCGLATPWPPDALYSVDLYAGSGGIGIIDLANQHLRPNPYGPLGPPWMTSDSQLCWFSTNELKPFAHLESAGAGQHATARGNMLYVSSPGGYAKSVTPDGIKDLTLPATCHFKTIGDYRHAYLLRAEQATAYTCAPSEFLIDRDGIAKIIKLGGKGLPIIQSDAWNAPVLLSIINSKLRIREAEFQNQERLALVNYSTGAIESLPPIKSVVRSTIYFGSSFSTSVSPQGERAAVLAGPQLTVFAWASGAGNHP
jgi:hypothetical protein